MSEDVINDESQALLAENTRRYYLDVMGVQSWALLPDVGSVGVASELVDSGVAVGEPAASESNPCAMTTGFNLLESSIQQCKKCQLHSTRKQAILGRGNQSATLMFVLLSPDKSDDKSGELCGGESFDLLRKMLAAINIAIDDVYITSLLKCHVPDIHTVSAGEIHHCNDYLRQQVSTVKPELLIILGDTAARCASQRDAELDKLRDELNTVSLNDLTCLEGVPLFVSYSPQELLHKAENKRKAWADLQLIQQLIQQMILKMSQR